MSGLLTPPLVVKGEERSLVHDGRPQLATVQRLFGRECIVRLPSGKLVRVFQDALGDPEIARVASAQGARRRPRRVIEKKDDVAPTLGRGKLERGEVPYQMVEGFGSDKWTDDFAEYLFFWCERYLQAKEAMLDRAPRQYQAWIYCYEEDLGATEAARKVREEWGDLRATPAMMKRAYYNAKARMRPVFDEWLAINRPMTTVTIDRGAFEQRYGLAA